MSGTAIPCSTGGCAWVASRRVEDAIAEIHFFASRSYEWVLEGDITACFDEISHSALLERVRDRIGDKRVLDLVKAFLKSGILSEGGRIIGTKTGTPQGGLCSAAHNPRRIQAVSATSSANFSDGFI